MPTVHIFQTIIVGKQAAGKQHQELQQDSRGSRVQAGATHQNLASLCSTQQPRCPIDCRPKVVSSASGCMRADLCHVPREDANLHNSPLVSLTNHTTFVCFFIHYKRGLGRLSKPNSVRTEAINCLQPVRKKMSSIKLTTTVHCLLLLSFEGEQLSKQRAGPESIFRHEVLN